MSAVHAEPFEPIVSRRGRGNLGVASWALSALVHVALAGVALLAVLLSNQPPPEPITVRLELVEAASPMVEHLASSAETSPAVAPSRAPDSVIAPAPPEVTQEPPVPPTPETVPVQPDGLSALRAVEPAPAPQPAKARPPQPRQVAQRAVPTAPLPAPTATPAAEPAQTAPTVPRAPPIAAPVGAVAAAAAPRAVPPSYAGAIWARLQRFKQYPSEARRSREEGTVQLLFTIDRAGRLLDWRLERSSGFERLDAAVRDMVERAAPFPPPPDDLLGQRFEFVLPVPFVLR